MKMLKVLVAVSILLVLCWSLVFFWGKNQVFQVSPRVAWLPVTLKWFVPCTASSPKAYGHFCDVNFVDSQFMVNARPLTPILERSAGPVLIRFMDNRPDMDLQFKSTFQNKKNLLIVSDADVVLRSVRGVEPDLLYGSTQSERLRLSMYERVGLVRAFSNSFDFFYSPALDLGVELLQPGTVSEMKSRGIPVIIGPLKNDAEVQNAVDLGADGLLVTDVALIY